MKSISISGFGGSYETACQVMLLRGIKYLSDRPNFDFSKYQTFNGVYGLSIALGKECKELDECMCKDIDATGAMHQAVISHLKMIHEKGYDEWMKIPDRKRIIEIDTLEDMEKLLIKENKEYEDKIRSGDLHNPLEALIMSGEIKVINMSKSGWEKDLEEEIRKGKQNKRQGDLNG